MPTLDPRVDAYIAKARPFAQPILRRMRELVHKGCPACVETIKWGFPNFDHHGGLCSMAAFKAHCVFGFWKAELLSDAERSLEVADRTAMGHLGRITSIADLPSARAFLSLVRQAARLNEAGVKVPRDLTRKPPLRVPAFFRKAIGTDAKALATFQSLAPSHKREYVEWVNEAKTEATRSRRLAATIEWLAAGKQRNWKYQTPRATTKQPAKTPRARTRTST